MLFRCARNERQSFAEWLAKMASEEPAKTPKEEPKLDELLSHQPLGRILQLEKLSDEFAQIKRAFAKEKKAVPGADEFRRVGAASGTHLLKLITPRAQVGQHLLRSKRTSADRHPELVPSIDAKMAPVAKLVFRPLEVAGHPTRTLADHILNPDDDVSPKVLEGFATAFGEDALEALREALTTPLPPIKSLPAAEFPIIFLPRPGGGDLQATPVAPAEAYIRFREVTEPYFRKQEEGASRVPRGRWIKQFVSDKPQNISSAVGQQRTRFWATMPRVLAQWSAELHRYAHGGRFPLWRDDGVIGEVEAYAKLLDRSKEYSNQNIRTGLDQLADRLIRAARDFIEETVAEARHEFPDIELPSPPPIVTVILRRRWPTTDDRDRARRALADDHFKGRLRAVGER